MTDGWEEYDEMEPLEIIASDPLSVEPETPIAPAAVQHPDQPPVLWPERTQPIHVPGEAPEGERLTLPVERLTPWDQAIRSADILGPFDCWLGTVIRTGYTDATIPLTGQAQAIYVERVGVNWGTNNEPKGWKAPMVHAHPVLGRTEALPWPPRHDQVDGHVAVGDIVAVITGRDGRSYFFSDDLPFPAKVIKSAANSTESQAGGAGLWLLTVRRQSMAGGGLSDLLTAAGAEVECEGVLVMRATSQHHGYRCGDVVWVQKRGLYYYALGARETFMAYLVNEGPQTEGDFATNHYWAREFDATVTYAGLNNAWTATYADRAAVDPSGSGGRYGRWVDAVNWGEAAADHGLTVVVPGAGPDPGTGTVVIVHVFADPDTGEPWYAFSRAPASVGFWARLTYRSPGHLGDADAYGCHEVEFDGTADAWVNKDGGIEIDADDAILHEIHDNCYAVTDLPAEPGPARTGEVVWVWTHHNNAEPPTPEYFFLANPKHRWGKLTGVASATVTINPCDDWEGTTVYTQYTIDLHKQPTGTTDGLAEDDIVSWYVDQNNTPMLIAGAARVGFWARLTERSGGNFQDPGAYSCHEVIYSTESSTWVNKTGGIEIDAFDGILHEIHNNGYAITTLPASPGPARSGEVVWVWAERSNDEPPTPEYFFLANPKHRWGKIYHITDETVSVYPCDASTGSTVYTQEEVGVNKQPVSSTKGLAVDDIVSWYVDQNNTPFLGPGVTIPSWGWAITSSFDAWVNGENKIKMTPCDHAGNALQVGAVQLYVTMPPDNAPRNIGFMYPKVYGYHMFPTPIPDGENPDIVGVLCQPIGPSEEYMMWKGYGRVSEDDRDHGYGFVQAHDENIEE